MSLENFKKFNNEVFNLPRDSFSNFNISKVKSLGEYLFSISDRFPDDGLHLSEIYSAIHNFLKESSIKNVNEDFESLFNLDLNDKSEIKKHYNNDVGRKFRHWMELASLLDLLSNKEFGNNRSKRYLTSFTEEIFLIPSNVLKSLLRDKILYINTISNSGLNNLRSNKIYAKLDYRPAIAILKYLHQIDRPCTKFELSIFFGRPNYNLKSENEIIEEAIKMGNYFPLTQDKQIEYYFDLNGWKDKNGSLYKYNQSQEPYFKFNAFFILMDAVDLIQIDSNERLVTLTDYSKSLFSKTEYPESSELKNLINEVQDLNVEEKTINKLTRNRSSIISKLISSDKKFIDDINFNASKKSGSKTKVNQKAALKRDELIREISKQKALYICQGCQNKTFIDKKGNNYVESHHIIEYNSKEEGPDVLQNLLVLCPNCHSKIHFARIDIVNAFYDSLRAKEAISIEQFKEIHSKLKLLKKTHIKTLLKKKIINQEESVELLDFIK